MISITTKTGIVLAAESRGNFYDEQKRPVAYYDTVDKVFRINDRLGLVSTGNEFIDGNLLSLAIKNFAKSRGKEIVINNLFEDLFAFLRPRFPTAARLLETQQFIAGGYGNGVAIVKCKNPNEGVRTFSGFQIIKASPHCDVGLPKSGEELNQEEAAGLVRKIIEDFALNGKYPDSAPPWQRVGGPIDILWIPRNKRFRVRWLKRKRSRKFKNICDFLAWARESEKVKLVEPFGRAELERIISIIEKQSNCS